MKSTLTALALGFAGAAATIVPAQAEEPAMYAETGLGKVLTDAKGMTLYTFDKDADGMSACYDKCAANWPPYLAPTGAKAEGEFGLATRKDGAQQWTYDGKPLYLWIKDGKPGETSGDGVNGVWHVVKAD